MWRWYQHDGALTDTQHSMKTKDNVIKKVDCWNSNELYVSF